MIRHCAAIVNSTPLFNPPESPNEPQPITPQQLITQRDEACREKYSRPTIYSNDDILAYGANRWKRTQALADEFWQYWQPYIYNIGTDRPKWIKEQPNAKVGDLVIIKEKGLPRNEWATGKITEVMPNNDNLVRRVIVQPLKRKYQKTTPAPRERAIHDLVLLKSLIIPEVSEPNNTKDSPLPN